MPPLGSGNFTCFRQLTFCVHITHFLKSSPRASWMVRSILVLVIGPSNHIMVLLIICILTCDKFAMYGKMTKISMATQSLRFFSSFERRVLIVSSFFFNFDNKSTYIKQ